MTHRDFGEAKAEATAEGAAESESSGWYPNMRTTAAAALWTTREGEEGRDHWYQSAAVWSVG